MSAPNVSYVPEGLWQPYETAERRAVSAVAVLWYALLAGAAAVLLFLIVPGLDPAITRIFYDGGHHFAGDSSPLFQTARAVFNVSFFLTCVATVAGLVIAGRTGGSWLGFGVRHWLYLALCLIVGPLIVANLGLKDHYGRARPRNVVEFGGVKAFTPAYQPADQCSRNCSFVSGEASSVYIIFFAGVFLLRRHARKMMLLGIVFGSLAGLTRIAQGGHFLSDVVFAGIFMALTAAGLRLLFDAMQADTTRAHDAEFVSPVA
jgi:lipid A 4'-phosphatase